jgi:hypothetical protein
MEDENMYNKRIEDLEIKVAELEKKIDGIVNDYEDIYRIGANLDVADFTIDRKRIL